MLLHYVLVTKESKILVAAQYSRGLTAVSQEFLRILKNRRRVLFEDNWKF